MKPDGRCMSTPMPPTEMNASSVRQARSCLAPGVICDARWRRLDEILLRLASRDPLH